jgi:hypothetical protein
VPLWPTVGRALGLRKTATYEAAAAGKLPVRVLHVGGKRAVATAELRRVLGLDPANEPVSTGGGR